MGSRNTKCQTALWLIPSKHNCVFNVQFWCAANLKSACLLFACYACSAMLSNITKVNEPYDMAMDASFLLNMSGTQ